MTPVGMQKSGPWHDEERLKCTAAVFSRSLMYRQQAMYLISSCCEPNSVQAALDAGIRAHCLLAAPASQVGVALALQSLHRSGSVSLTSTAASAWCVHVCEHDGCWGACAAHLEGCQPCRTFAAGRLLLRQTSRLYSHNWAKHSVLACSRTLGCHVPQ